MLLAVVVHRCLQAQLLIDGLVERLAEVGHLLDKLDQLLQLQSEEHRRGDGAHADRRFLLVQQVGLAEVFAVTQQRNPQVLAVRATADDLGLTRGHDEEALLVLALLDEQLVHVHLLRLERVDEAVHYLVVKFREQRDGLQVLRRKRGHAVDVLYRQAVVLTEFHLRAVHAERSAADLHPGQQFQQ